jgi:acetyl-CoA carboxylase biotin carboxyl carrier protein
VGVAERPPPPRALQAAGEHADEERPVAEVRAEMVANVWKVVASERDQVDDGDTLVILESMKMEIPVVAEGDVVQEGNRIAIIS